MFLVNATRPHFYNGVTNRGGVILRTGLSNKPMQKDTYMKRIALAAALAGAVAAPAFAQSNVTIYGRINTTIENQKAGDAKSVTVMQNNSSRIGFKGTEDLGGGLKVGFQLEHGFNSDTGVATHGNAFWARQSEVNIGGGFGMVRLGNYTAESYFATADYISMHNHDTGTSSDALYAYVMRDVNKIAYRTPSLGGVTLEGAVSLKEAGDDHAYDLAANYQAGPLHLGAGYTKLGDSNQFAVRGLYEMGAFTFGAYFQRDKNNFAAGSRNNFRLSGMYTMGASELHVNFGYAGKNGDVSDSKANQFTLGYNYNLSKRTKVYAFFTKLSDGDAGLYGGDFRSIAAGIRHNF